MKANTVLALDLDETLVSSRASPDTLGALRYENYWIAPRPGLRKFLKYVDRKFHIVICTAAARNYAHFVVESFIRPHIEIANDVIFSREFCDQSIGPKVHKNIALLADLLKKPRDNILILDNLNKVIRENKKKGIVIKSWYADHPGAQSDRYLYEMQGYMSQEIFGSQ